MLVLIDVEQTVAAPLAQKQGWSRKLETAYVERPVYLPPEARKLVLGASLQPNQDFNSEWEVAVIDLAEPVAVRSIARSESGYLDEINGDRGGDDAARRGISGAGRQPDGRRPSCGPTVHVAVGGGRAGAWTAS